MDYETHQVPAHSNGWTKWGKHVLKELERQDSTDVDIVSRVNKLEIDQAVLKMKSGIWGAIGASIPIIIAIAIWLLTSGVLSNNKTSMIYHDDRIPMPIPTKTVRPNGSP